MDFKYVLMVRRKDFRKCVLKKMKEGKTKKKAKELCGRKNEIL